MNSVRNTILNLPYFLSMVLNTFKLPLPEQDSDFKPRATEIGMLSNASSANSHAEPPHSQTASATLTLKPLKIGSKPSFAGLILLTKHFFREAP